MISKETVSTSSAPVAMAVRKNPGDLLNEVQYRNGKIVIIKAGKSVAALIDIAMFDRIGKLDEEFDQSIVWFPECLEM